MALATRQGHLHLLLLLLLVAAELLISCPLQTTVVHVAAQGNNANVPAQFRSASGGVGLAPDFYRTSCPNANAIIESHIRGVIQRNPSEAAGLIRIMFHDCFVQGCDASILLSQPPILVSEQIAAPNNASLRPSSLRIIEDIKAKLEAACPRTVSCADIISLATVAALPLVGGPKISVLTGRRDSQTAASNQTVIANIPSPLLSNAGLKQIFQNHSLDVNDLVALSGAHTFGQAHCRIIDLQLTPNVSTDLNPAFAANLSRICLQQKPSVVKNPGALTAHLDFVTKDAFDNNYFRNVLNKVAVFHSDAALLNASDTLQLVQLYASDQSQFFRQFQISMVKLSQLGVLTGSNGIIRQKCSTPS